MAGRNFLLAIFVAAATCAPIPPSDRSLHIRSIPGVQGVTSNVYEILMQPYTFDIRPLTAVVELTGEEAEEGDGAHGVLVFTQVHPPVGPVLVTGNVTGLSPGMHGIHVHEWGDLREGCSAAGPHFNPYQVQHGSPGDPIRHVGDLGNLLADDDGAVQVQIVDPLISLAGPRGILGRSVTVRAGQDDLGRGGTTDSLTTGGKSPPVACGVVGYMPPPAPGHLAPRARSGLP